MGRISPHHPRLIRIAIDLGVPVFARAARTRVASRIASRGSG